MTTAFSIALDTSVKAGAIGLLAWAGTARAGLADARRAHQVWCGAAAAFVLLPLAFLLLTPAAALVPTATMAAILPSIDTIPSGLVVGYTAVSGVLLARTVLGLAAVRSLFARALPLEADADAADLQKACAGARAMLVESAVVGAPATAGVLRPRVLLPAGWREMPRLAIVAAVDHELAHVGRRDYLVLLAIDVICALWWFHPVTWLARRRIRWFAELACDADAAVAVGYEDYARALVAVAGGGAGPGYGRVLAATSALGHRVQLLLAAPARRTARVRLVVLVALALLPILLTVRVGPRAIAGAAVDSAPHAALHAATHGARHHAH